MRQHQFVKKGVTVVVTAAMLASPAMAEPAVTGPESVKQWYEAGNDFIRQSKRLRENDRKAKNVILFIGDGMGVSTVTAARILQGQMNGKPGEENRLSFEKFPYVALSKTYSWDQQTSDSAPTMTAMVTGYKARESMLSVDHTTTRGECNASVIDSKSLPTILELAAKSGRDTGVVSTARITHATPAANYAHTAVRDWEADSNQPAGCGVKDIAKQLIEVSPTVKKSLKAVLGGGRRSFLPRIADEEGVLGRRNDGRDLRAEWVTSRGFGAKYVWNKAGFDAAMPHNTRYLFGLFESDHMEYEADRANDAGGEPSLTEMTKKAIELLRGNKKGFYLHVEAGRIDHAHHAGNAKRALLDTIEFSNAIKKAYEMTDPDETLILVSADHSHVFTIAGYPHRGNPILGLVRGVPAVDGTPTSLDPDFKGLPYTTLGYHNGPGWRGLPTRPTLVDTAVPENIPVPVFPPPGTFNPTHTQWVEFLQEAAIPLGSETHAGEDVAIYASGPKSHLVHGSMEQNWIFHVMHEAFDLDTKHWGH